LGKIWFVAITVFLISAGVYLKYQEPSSELATVNAIALNLHNAPTATASSRMRTTVNGTTRELTLPHGTQVRIIEKLNNG
jgi:hypothetical protein